MNPSKEYRRKLPHIQPDNGVFFITFRLVDSIPKKVLDELHSNCQRVIESGESTQKEINLAKQDYFDAVEDILDKASEGPIWLKQPEIEEVVSQSLHYYDGKVFKLVCYCIMSNHIHFVAYAFKKPVFQVMKSLKTFTANKANKKLGHKGRFWQREYFDRLVRDRNDLDVKIKYTLNNPVKIGLVENWKQWTYSYCNPKFRED